MTVKWVGMPDREAFADIFNEVKDVMEYAHRMRGETTDEDLVEKLIWRLEAFADIFNEVKDVMEYAHRMRGETTDEDLVEKLIWRLEAIIGYTGE